MERLSPLKASIETFKQFKAQRTEKNENSKVHSNPFGITFKGTMLNMDVFETIAPKNDTGLIETHFPTIKKFVASARVATLNRYNSLRNSVVSFGGRMKQEAKDMIEKVKNPETYAVLNPQNSVSYLGKKSVGDLEAMLKDALIARGA